MQQLQHACEILKLLTEIIMSARLAWIPFTCLETVEPATHKACMEILKVYQNTSVDRGMM